MRSNFFIHSVVHGLRRKLIKFVSRKIYKWIVYDFFIDVDTQYGLNSLELYLSSTDVFHRTCIFIIFLGNFEKCVTTILARFKDADKVVQHVFSHANINQKNSLIIRLIVSNQVFMKSTV